MKELRSELNRFQSDYQEKLSSQIKMVITYSFLQQKKHHILQVDANNRSTFKTTDRIGVLTDWLRSLGKLEIHQMNKFHFFKIIFYK
jgi:hypothetical protein